MTILTGRCQCEAIAYEKNGPLGDVYNCHCSKCRRWGGDAFRTSTTADTSAFKWIKGEDTLSKWQANENVTKTFCSICGTNLVSLYKHKPDKIGISLGGLDQDPGVRPLAHIFVNSKAPWYIIQDGLPQYPEHSPNMKKS